MYKTKLSSAVTAILESSEKPMTVADINAELAQQGVTPNKTSLYRLLEKLEKNHQVEAFQIAEGVTHYEHAKPPHGHLVCQSCTSVSCIDAPIPEGWLRQIQQNHDASPTHISLSIKGLCAKCTS